MAHSDGLIKTWRGGKPEKAEWAIHPFEDENNNNNNLAVYPTM